MSQRAKSALSVFLGISILGITTWGLYSLAQWFIETLTKADANVRAATIAACATIGVSVISVLVSKFLENRSLVFKENRDKKVPVYEELITFTFEILYGQRLEDAVSEREMLKFFADNLPRITVWASDEVISSFGRFRRLALQGKPIELIFQYEKVI